MKVTYIGERSGPDEIRQYGFTFERMGDAVVIPNDHPRAAKFVGNPYFKCEDLPKGSADFDGSAATSQAAVIEGIVDPTLASVT